VVAEEFEPLVGAGAITRAFERGNVRQRAIQQRDIVEAIADAGFQRGVGTAAPARLFMPV